MLIGILRLSEIKSKKFFISFGIIPLGISIPDDDEDEKKDS